MNDKEIETIRNRCENATGGKWIAYIEGRDIECGSSFIQTAGEEDLEIDGSNDYDYDFIAHARQDIITLIDEIENLHSNRYTLNNDGLQRIRIRYEKANKELWIFLDENNNIECSTENDWDFIKPVGKDFKIYGATVADYEFISHSRQDIISLLDTIEILRSKEA